MAPHLRLWHTDPDGVLTTEEDAFRLTVRPPKREGGAAWFLVLRQLGTEFSIAAGGTERLKINRFSGRFQEIRPAFAGG
jgi:hypothetical protein